jgi:signal transduction histidine kinase
MNATIEDLVDSARLESGQLKLDRRPLDLPGLVRDLVERLAASESPSRTIRVEALPGVGPVLADANRIERVLTNLLTNAIKYSSAPSEVTVSIIPRDREIVTAISDEGIGISAGELAHLFERYYRAEGARERRGEGLGLGLYITKMFVEAHGGRIRAESEFGRGSTFFFSLPLAH